jgi:hypothetical protein
MNVGEQRPVKKCGIAFEEERTQLFILLRPPVHASPFSIPSRTHIVVWEIVFRH